jgi:hypothetical protein
VISDKEIAEGEEATVSITMGVEVGGTDKLSDGVEIWEVLMINIFVKGLLIIVIYRQCVMTYPLTKLYLFYRETHNQREKPDDRCGNGEKKW